MKTIRRPISILLAVLMVVGMFTMVPISAGAASYVAQVGETKYESLEEAIAAISTVTPEYHSKSGLTINKYEAKGYIKLLADCAGNGIVIDSGSGLTIDFDGHTYTVDGDLVGSNGTESLGFQLLKNSDVAFENGTITSEKAKILVQNYSNLGLYGMTLTLNNTSYNGAYTLSNNNGNAGIHNTTINANPTPGSFAFDVCRYSSYPSVHVEVTGEESVINGNVEISASNGQAKDGFYLILGGGTMNGNIVVDPSAQTAIEDDPGKAVVTKDNTFTQTAPEGFKWVDNGQGSSTLVALPYAAKIGNTKYRTLEEAFAAAQDGDTITLLGDCTGNGIKVPQGKFNNNGLTVDFVDYTYTIDGETVGSTGTETNGFQLLKDNKLTFMGGTIYSEKAKILVQNYSDLTLYGMTLTLDNQNYTSAYTLSNNNGDVVIDSTTINANPEGGFAFDVCRFSSYPSVNVTVKGDSEINGDVEISASKGQAKDGFSLTLESGSMSGDIVVDASAQALVGEDNNKVTKADTFTKTAPEGFKWVSNEDGTASLAPIPYVAKIGNAKYETLEAAFAAAKDGETITVLTDCEGNGIKAPQGKFATGLTVDFAGHTYTVSGTPVGSTGTETIGFQLLKGNKITFKNGTITGNSNENTDLQRMIQNYSDLTLDNMTVSMVGRYYDQITVSTCNGKTVIKDSKISAPDYTWANITDPAAVRAAALTVGTFSSYPSIDVTVEGTSVINGDVNVSDDNNKKAFSLTLKGGELNGNINLDENAKAAIDDTASTANVTKADTFTQEAPEGYKWVSNEDGTASLAPIPYVAQIGSNKYETLEAAFAAAQDGETITLLTDCAGNGIKAPQGKFASGLTVDFAGFTYTVDGETVGSSGTETNGFQLLKDNKITFQNGTITSAKAKILVQNYSDLTLEGMTLTLNNPNYTSAYTLSNNNGNIVIDDTTINANPAGGFAFDVCRFSSYPSVHVTVTGESKIKGDVEISASKGLAKEGFSLTLESGTMTGDIVVDASAQALVGEDNNKVTKANTFTQDPAEGFEWKDNGDGTSTLVKVADLFVAHSITLGGDIGVNFYLDPAVLDTYDGAKTVKFTWDGQELTVDVPTTPEANGYKVTCNVVAAEMANNIHVDVYAGDKKLAQEDDYSVQQYAELVYNNPTAYDTKGKPGKLQDLAKALLNYGAQAQTVFNNTLIEKPDHLANVTVGQLDYSGITADDIKEAVNGDATDLAAVAPQFDAKYYTSSVIYLSENTLRIYFTPVDGSMTMANVGDYDGNMSNYYYFVEENDIPAADLDELVDFVIGGVPFSYSPLNYAAAVLNSGMSPAQKDLAKSLFVYNQCANEYFD